MRTVSLLVYRHVPWAGIVPVWVVIALAILALFAFADLSSSGIVQPQPDGPYLAPFRWHSVARVVA